ncbi:hypothetical protein AC1031_013768 [Aphanomyces cochlioides]|nr:hypothetical protein AC1031_013768 [Aphanomyces cochlioides]
MGNQALTLKKEEELGRKLWLLGCPRDSALLIWFHGADAVVVSSWEYANEHAESTAQTFVAFLVVVRHFHHEYTIRRRYSQFVQLDQSLRHDGLTLALKLPTSTVWTNVCLPFMPQLTLLERQRQLQAFLDEINAESSLHSAPALLDFVGERPEAKVGYTSLMDYRLTWQHNKKAVSTARAKLQTEKAR